MARRFSLRQVKYGIFSGGDVEPPQVELPCEAPAVVGADGDYHLQRPEQVHVVLVNLIHGY
jgi:hypothetical protein